MLNACSHILHRLAKFFIEASDERGKSIMTQTRHYYRASRFLEFELVSVDGSGTV